MTSLAASTFMGVLWMLPPASVQAFVLTGPLAHSSPLCTMPSLPRPALRPSTAPAFYPSFSMLDLDESSARARPWTAIRLGQISETVAATLSLMLQDALATVLQDARRLVHRTNVIANAILTAAPMRLATRFLEQLQMPWWNASVGPRTIDVTVVNSQHVEDEKAEIFLKQLYLQRVSSRASTLASRCREQLRKDAAPGLIARCREQLREEESSWGHKEQGEVSHSDKWFNCAPICGLGPLTG